MFGFEQATRIEHKIDALLVAAHHILKRELKMDARIQSAIDEIAKTNSIEAASAQALSLQTQSISDLKQQVADLTAKVASGSTVSQADLDALSTAVGSLHDQSVALQTATPAGTSADPNAPTVDAGTGGASGSV